MEGRPKTDDYAERVLKYENLLYNLTSSLSGLRVKTQPSTSPTSIAKPVSSSSSIPSPPPPSSTSSILKPQPELNTSSISIVSHVHGRERREERGIDKRQLQEAVKYGRKERANPGRDGKPRWRYTHKGIVYITDDTSRHEITSWKLADALEAPQQAAGSLGGGGGKSHVVVVVDSSGSMRKEDVPGYASRTAAVYDCLARDLVEPQLKVEGSSMELSLIEMSDGATVVLERYTPNQELLNYLKSRASHRAASHGNYLPALDKALELLAGDAGRQSQLFLVFLSDGAPSDHTSMTCSHGFAVWQPYDDAYGYLLTRKGKPRLQVCPYSTDCRATVRQSVKELCVQKVRTIGDLLGRDRVFIGTVAFGPPSETYDVLKSMAEALPRSSFQKLGLSAACLRTAFTSLTSSLTSLRTELAAAVGAGGKGLTLRSDIAAKTERKSYEERQMLMNGASWDVYSGRKCRAKKRYDARSNVMVDAPYTDTELVSSWRQAHPNLERGIAHATAKFGEGAERVVFQCTEVVTFNGGVTAFCVGPRLVAKATRFTEHLNNEQFHRTFCRTQGEAEELAQLFNRRLRGGPEWQVRFLPCFVYTLEDARWERGVVDILVEEELEGKFTKWNNNAGGVARPALAASNAQLLAIVEEEDEEQEQASADHVPQCFSHFTYHATDGRKLVCDLQGVWNPVDGFVLTDPVIHHHTGSKRNGATDKGPAGIRSFFATHVCNPLCRRLGLPESDGGV